MGLFYVNMPLLYGEGGAKAFSRLQEEIMKGTEDYTLFAWSAQVKLPSGIQLGLLADSPQDFGNPEGYLQRGWQYSDLRVSSPAEFSSLHGLPRRGQLQEFQDDPPYVTSRGLSISLLVGQGRTDEYFACLYCPRELNRELLWPCVTLRKLENGLLLYGRTRAHEIMFLTTEQIQTFKYSTIYIAQAAPKDDQLRNFNLSVVPYLPIRRIGQLAHFFPAVRQYRPVDQLAPN
jgi:hypothetical protein